MVERALRTADVAALSNNEIKRRLNVDIGTVRATRRRLESCGDIAAVLHRVSRHGRLVDVSRVLNSRGQKTAGDQL
jgi:hypothetical protein